MLRVWSRLRSKLSHRWEKDHADEAFWGITDKPCERAVWCHNILNEFAKKRHLAAASLLTDLQTFYE